MLTDTFFSSLQRRVDAMKLLMDKPVVEAIANAACLIVKAYSNSGKILVAGNGGSAAQSLHLCSELMGRLKLSRNPISAIPLCGDVSTITCIGNDFGYERIFSRQIEALARPNDLFIAFTTSGKSRNIIEALTQCNAIGVDSLVITGKNISSVTTAKQILSLPIDDKCILQEAQMQVIHILCENIESILYSPRLVWSEVLNCPPKYNALVLDRDGIINKSKANGYVSSFDEFCFNDDFISVAPDLAKRFKYIFVATNQKGVARGLVSIDDIHSIHTEMIRAIEKAGGRIDKIYLSTGLDSKDDMRKPNIGMALLMKQDFPDLVFENAIVVGDSNSDMAFADNIKAKFFYAATR